LCLTVATTGVALAADSQPTSPKSLYDARQWFELQDAAQAANVPVFYRLVAVCVFDDVSRAERQLKALCKSAPGSAEVLEPCWPFSPTLAVCAELQRFFAPCAGAPNPESLDVAHPNSN
jgi:hypothetical protein